MGNEQDWLKFDEMNPDWFSLECHDLNNYSC